MGYISELYEANQRIERDLAERQIWPRLNALQQQDVVTLRAIMQAIDERGFPPNHEDLGEMLAIKSMNTSHRLVHRLEDAGLLVARSRRARGIRISPQGFALLVATAGSVALMGERKSNGSYWRSWPVLSLP
jgi:SOS-response transcriptional repressor LexA